MGAANYFVATTFSPGDDHDHLSAFHLRHLLDLPRGIEIRLDPFQHDASEFLVRHFAAPEAQVIFTLSPSSRKRHISSLIW